MSDTTPTTPPAETGKTRKPRTTKAAAPAGTEPPLINPDWAAHVIKKEDIVGKTAELAVAVLTAAIQKQVIKATKPEKLEKIVWSAITEARRQARA